MNAVFNETKNELDGAANFVHFAWKSDARCTLLSLCKFGIGQSNGRTVRGKCKMAAKDRFRGSHSLLSLK